MNPIEEHAGPGEEGYLRRREILSILVVMTMMTLMTMMMLITKK